MHLVYFVVVRTEDVDVFKNAALVANLLAYIVPQTDEAETSDVSVVTGFVFAWFQHRIRFGQANNVILCFTKVKSLGTQSGLVVYLPTTGGLNGFCKRL